MDIITILLGLIPADIFAKLELVITWVTAIVTAASAIVALTPSPKDDGILATIRKWVEILALNVKNAKK
jgi:hypothetical protein